MMTISSPTCSPAFGTRIDRPQARRHAGLRIRVGIANVLNDEGFVEDYRVEEGSPARST